MNLSKLHYVSQNTTAKKHLENIQQACQSGAELVQLKLENISEKKALKIATEAREITEHFQTRLIITNLYKIAKEVKADGVYFDKVGINISEIKKQLFSWQTIGASANTLKDCSVLLNKKADYIGLGPFKNTENCIGTNGYLTILEELKTATPIIAFGGIEINDILDLMMTKVYGVAISDPITQNFNIIPKINSFLGAASTNEQVYKLGETEDSDKDKEN